VTGNREEKLGKKRRTSGKSPANVEFGTFECPGGVRFLRGGGSYLQGNSDWMVS